jgi:hypothetical protein
MVLIMLTCVHFKCTVKTKRKENIFVCAIMFIMFNNMPFECTMYDFNLDIDWQLFVQNAHALYI